MTNETSRTSAATAARMKARDDRYAARLRERGWVVIPPLELVETVARLRALMHEPQEPAEDRPAPMVASVSPWASSVRERFDGVEVHPFALAADSGSCGLPSCPFPHADDQCRTCGLQRAIHP